MRRGLLLLLLCGGVLMLGGAALLTRERLARCAAVPLLAGDLLPAIDAAQLQTGGPLPKGWSGLAPGVKVGDFAIMPGTHSFQLIGIANALQTPAVDVRPGDTYCVAAQAIVDSPVSSTKLRAAFRWIDRQRNLIAMDQTDWQDVRRWEGPGDHGGWSRVAGAFRAPPGAALLMIGFHPASDDRVYLDDMHIRAGGDVLATNDQRPTTNDQRPTTEDDRRTTTDERQASSLQPPASSLQPPASSLQPPASSLQPPASSLQPPAMVVRGCGSSRGPTGAALRSRSPSTGRPRWAG
jgi:hypothetical protein